MKRGDDGGGNRRKDEITFFRHKTKVRPFFLRVYLSFLDSGWTHKVA